MNDSSDFWKDAEIINTYLVADGVADGTMRPIDPAIAAEAGFKIPVIMTTGAWADLVAWERDDSSQDEEGRLWDVLFMTNLKARLNRESNDITVEIGRVPNRTKSGALSNAERPERVTFNAVVQAYDTSGAPCLTIFLPEER